MLSRRTLLEMIFLQALLSHGSVSSAQNQCIPAIKRLLVRPYHFNDPMPTLGRAVDDLPLDQVKKILAEKGIKFHCASIKTCGAERNIVVIDSAPGLKTDDSDHLNEFVKTLQREFEKYLGHDEIFPIVVIAPEILPSNYGAMYRNDILFLSREAWLTGEASPKDWHEFSHGIVSALEQSEDNDTLFSARMIARGTLFWKSQGEYRNFRADESLAYLTQLERSLNKNGSHDDLSDVAFMAWGAANDFVSFERDEKTKIIPGQFGSADGYFITGNLVDRGDKYSLFNHGTAASVFIPKQRGVDSPMTAELKFKALQNLLSKNQPNIDKIYELSLEDKPTEGLKKETGLAIENLFRRSLLQPLKDK